MLLAPSTARSRYVPGVASGWVYCKLFESAPKYRTGLPLRSNAASWEAPDSRTSTTPGLVTATAVGDCIRPGWLPTPPVYAARLGSDVLARLDWAATGLRKPTRPLSVWIATTWPEECSAAAETGSRNVPSDFVESQVIAPVVGSRLTLRTE